MGYNEDGLKNIRGDHFGGLKDGKNKEIEQYVH